METTLQKISRKTGKKQSFCKCTLCKSQCNHPCLGTPEDIINIIQAGHGDKLALTDWGAGIVMGVTDKVIPMIAPRLDHHKQACSFFNNGLCDLHSCGLKPTEGKLSHHTLTDTNFNPKKSLAWAVAKEWTAYTEDEVIEFIDKYKPSAPAANI